jgi:hypothetical protein
MKIPREIYIPLVLISTELILLAAATVIMLPTGLLTVLPMGILAIFMAYKTLIISVGLIVAARWLWSEQLLGVGGHYLGRVVGMVLGGIIGWKYAGVIGGVILAIALYFAVGRFGWWISLALDAQARKLGLFPKVIAIAAPPPVSGRLIWLLYAYSLGTPTLFTLLAIAWSYFNIPVADQGVQFLPWARFVVVVLSLSAILMPWWLLMRRATAISPTDTDSYRRSLRVLGIAASITPAGFGIVLFIAFGASLTEVLIFGLVSAVAGFCWITRIMQSPFGNQSG